MRKRVEATILHLIEVGNNRKRCVNLQRVVEPISNGFQWFHDKTGLERILYLFAINRTLWSGKNFQYFENRPNHEWDNGQGQIINPRH